MRHLATLMLSLTVFGTAQATAAEVNIYTTREPKLVQPLLEAYSKSTGTKINVVFLKDGMAERIAAEGASSPADIMMAVDAGNLIDLVDKGLTQPVQSKVLKSAIPAELRAADDQWFGLSWRARVIYAAKDLDIETIHYEDLADPKYKGQVCIRSGQHPYNTALTAAYISHHGEEDTAKWLTGLRDNLARKPGGGDRDVAKDIVGGICKIGLANSYYVGLMRSGSGGPEQRPWGDGINVKLPTFTNGGTHVNINGVVLAKNAPNRDEAVKLMEFLVSDEAQKIYAGANYEYPVKKGVAVDPIIASFGEVTIDNLPLAEIVKNRKAATELIDKVGFDN
ncbi:extracellular solute-binding protein [Aestuariivirga sp.]|uniref:extracellular solute-binding protein n=1 Tax=Aestuariivirga sp. TaxID=2650926 RepID=UPI003BAB1016